MMDKPIIQYTIREAVPEDAASYNAHRRRIADEPNNGITYHVGEYNHTVDDDLQRVITAQESDNRVIFVAVNESKQVIGVCSGFSPDKLSTRHRAGVGIDVNKDYRRQGIGTALMKDIIVWADANPDVHRLELEVFTPNIRALQLYLKLGFVIEGTRHKAYRKHGQFIDAYMMAILFEVND